MIGLGYSKRGPLAAVKLLFPDIILSEGITEEDDLWATTGGNESEEEAGQRIQSAFKEVWEEAKDDDCLPPSPIIRRKLIIRHRNSIPQRDVQYPLAPGLQC